MNDGLLKSVNTTIAAHYPNHTFLRISKSEEDDWKIFRVCVGPALLCYIEVEGFRLKGIYSNKDLMHHMTIFIRNYLILYKHHTINQDKLNTWKLILVEMGYILWRNRDEIDEDIQIEIITFIIAVQKEAKDE